MTRGFSPTSLRCVNEPNYFLTWPLLEYYSARIINIIQRNRNTQDTVDHMNICWLMSQIPQLSAQVH